MNKFKFTTKELIFKRDVYKFGKKKKSLTINHMVVSKGLSVHKFQMDESTICIVCCTDIIMTILAPTCQMSLEHYQIALIQLQDWK